MGGVVEGPGEAGQWTRQPGMLAYYEICKNLANGWTKGKYAEMEFLNGISRFLAINLIETRVFDPHFSVLQNAIHE